MIFSIFKEQGVFGVDRQFRQINLADLPPGVAIVHWDDDRQTGVVEFEPTVTVEVQERDFEAEAEAEAYARDNNLDLSKLEPIYKSVTIRRPNMVLTTFENFEYLIARWEAAAPPPPPPPTAEELAEAARIQDMDAEIKGGTIGAVSPKTVAELKLLPRAELRAWFDLNFDTEVRLRRLVRWIFFFVIRNL